jgi:hypothetical protein
MQRACYAVVDGFTDLSGSASKRREMYVELTASILSFALAILILAFFGKWLWNNVVIELFTFAKPARNVWQIIGLTIFLSLMK